MRSALSTTGKSNITTIHISRYPVSMVVGPWLHSSRKADASAPHEILLVLDAGIGQNSLNQAQQFHQAVGLTGLVLTKLDGTAKGGVVLNIARAMKLPIRFIGIGEQAEDLDVFRAGDFVEALLGPGSAAK